MDCVKYILDVIVPTADKDGKKVYESISFKEFIQDNKSFKNVKLTENVSLKQGQCAKIKLTSKYAVYENLAFNIKHKFTVGKEND